jgi:hypothetical protein
MPRFQRRQNFREKGEKVLQLSSSMYEIFKKYPVETISEKI